MATVKILGATKLLENLKALEKQVLPELGKAARTEAEEILTAAQVNVPRGKTEELSGSGFVSGPKIRRGRKHSAIATAGFEAKYAAYEHEGYHYGKKISEPPKWLEHAARGRLDKFKKKIAQVISTFTEG